MKVLWITNLLFPEAEALMGGNGVLKATGGWLLAASQALLDTGNIILSVATVSSKVKDLVRVQGKHIYYYVIPRGKGNYKYNKEYEKYLDGQIYGADIATIINKAVNQNEKNGV